MTASLPMPHDAHPNSPDGGHGGARGNVTPLPPKPRTPPEVAAAQDLEPAPATEDGNATQTGQSSQATPAPKRPAAKRPAAKRPAATRAPAKKAVRKKSPPDSAAQTPDPGPPPPLPADLAIPPKPPLPPAKPTIDAATAAHAPAGSATAAASMVHAPAATDAAVQAPDERTDTQDAVHAPAVTDAATPPATQTVEAAGESAPRVPVIADPVDDAEPLVAHAPAEPLVEDAPGEPLVEDAPGEPLVEEPVPPVEDAPEEPLIEEPVLPAADDGAAAEGAGAAVAVEVLERPETVTEAPTAASVDEDMPALVVKGVAKRFGETRAVDSIDLTVPAGIFYGLVGPNGAGKTTTLSMIAGLLQPDRGSIRVNGIDAAADPLAAKRQMGVLPDRLRTFDRLTGRQLLHYYGVLRGLPAAVVASRTSDLARAFDLSEALGRPVSDYSAGMVKKVMLAGAMIHSPRLLVLDEPFESVDPVSSAVILEILSTYVEHGGTVILSSHGMELVERVCSRLAVVVSGQVLAEGTIDEVRGELTLEQRFIELAGGLGDVEGLEWLHTFSG